MTVRNVKTIAVTFMVTTHNSILVDYTIEDANADKNIIRFQYLIKKIAVTKQKIQVSNG